MDNNFHMKKFFEDVYKDSSMYDEYINGKVFLNYELYDKWYKDMIKRSLIFSDTINGMSSLGGSDRFFETTTCREFAVTKLIGAKKEIEIKKFMMPKIETGVLGDDTHHYICNGCYETTLENIYKVLNKGAFTVGICCEKKTDEFRSIAKYYNELKHFLMMKGYIASSFESNMPGNNRLYLLSYNSYRNKKNKKQVII